MPVWVYVAIGAGLLVLVLIGLYNSLVSRRLETKNAWSQIEVQLKRRYDLIPNLVETVKGFAKHEKETLEGVISARNKAFGAINQGPAAISRAEGELSGALGRLLAISEAYPDLKANANFLALQEELTATENRIGFARQHYNDAVSGYNNRLLQFPGNLVADLMGFKPAEFFQLDAAESAKVKEAPKVQF
jgi:LemA protein